MWRLLYNNFAVVFGLVYVYLPFMVLPLYASLDRMDKSLTWRRVWTSARANCRTIFSPSSCRWRMPGIVSRCIIITFIPSPRVAFLTPDLLGGTDSQMIANVIERQFKSRERLAIRRGAVVPAHVHHILRLGWRVRSLMSKGTSASMEAGIDGFVRRDKAANAMRRIAKDYGSNTACSDLTTPEPVVITLICFSTRPSSP